MSPTSRRLLSPRATAALAGLVGILGTLAFVERPLTAPLSDRVEIADLTWVELRELVRHGFTTAIVPSGGLEQNGPHLVIGKHDRIVAETARAIATRLGRTLVAPVISYVPEGDPESRTGNMAFPGTVGVSEPVFEGMLEGIAGSLKASGFRIICLVADHSGSLPAQRRVAERLSRDWAGQGVRVLSVDYASDEAQLAWLRGQGETDSTIGRHGGIQDTAELMAVHPDGYRPAGWTDRPTWSEPTGADGDPSRATVERGRALLAMKVEAAVSQIRGVLPSEFSLRTGTPD